MRLIYAKNLALSLPTVNIQQMEAIFKCKYTIRGPWVPEHERTVRKGRKRAPGTKLNVIILRQLWMGKKHSSASIWRGMLQGSGCPGSSPLCLDWLSGVLKTPTLNQQLAKSPELSSKQWLFHFISCVTLGKSSFLICRRKMRGLYQSTVAA